MKQPTFGKSWPPAKPRITRVNGLWGIANSSVHLKTSWFFQALEWCRKRNQRAGCTGAAETAKDMERKNMALMCNS